MKVKEESEKAGLKLNIQNTKILASGPITSWQTDGETVATMRDFIFLVSRISADDDCSHEIKRCLLLGRKAMTNLVSILKSREITLPTKVPVVRAMVFPVAMYGCESWTIEKSWASKNLCFWTVVLVKTLENPLNSKESQPVHPKGNQSWIFIGKTDAEARAPVLWPPDSKSWLLGKRPWCWEGLRAGGEGAAEDEMVGWHWLDGQGFEQAPGDGDGWRNLVCCIPWCCKDSDLTEQLNNNNSKAESMVEWAKLPEFSVSIKKSQKQIRPCVTIVVLEFAILHFTVF